jgi:hypothetical protein
MLSTFYSAALGVAVVKVSQRSLRGQLLPARHTLLPSPQGQTAAQMQEYILRGSKHKHNPCCSWRCSTSTSTHHVAKQGQKRHAQAQQLGREQQPPGHQHSIFCCWHTQAAWSVNLLLVVALKRTKGVVKSWGLSKADMRRQGLGLRAHKHSTSNSHHASQVRSYVTTPVRS